MLNSNLLNFSIASFFPVVKILSWFIVFQPQIQTMTSPLPTVWSWISALSCLCLRFISHKPETITVVLFLMIVKIKWKCLKHYNSTDKHMYCCFVSINYFCCCYNNDNHWDWWWWCWWWLLLLLSRFSRVQLCATPQREAHQAPPSLGFSRQEHWSWLPFPSPMQESEKWKWSRSVMSNS